MLFKDPTSQRRWRRIGRDLPQRRWTDIASIKLYILRTINFTFTGLNSHGTFFIKGDKRLEVPSSKKNIASKSRRFSSFASTLDQNMSHWIPLYRKGKLALRPISFFGRRRVGNRTNLLSILTPSRDSSEKKLASPVRNFLLQETIASYAS